MEKAQDPMLTTTQPAERVVGDTVALVCYEVIALSPDEVATLVGQIKAEADRYWMINPNRSLELAEQIIEIGQARGEPQHTALGTLARGDALKLLGRAAEAWQALSEAGSLFRAIDDEVGWARTRIGRLLICVDLQRVEEALVDAAEAGAIFIAAGAHDKRLVLNMNTAIVHHLLGDYGRSLELYLTALELAESMPEIGAQWFGSIHINLGYVYDLQGDFARALDHYARGRRHCASRGEVGSVAMIDLNSAHIAMAQGRYREALRLLQLAYEFYTPEGLSLDATHVDADRVECYLLLNRYAEARDLGRRVCREFRAAGAAYWEALSLLHLATAEATLGDKSAALAALEAAEASFASLESDSWAATARLRRGKIAMLQGDLEGAAREARYAAAVFAASGRQVDYAEARLLCGEALLGMGQIAAAAGAGAHALTVARRCHVPHLRYGAHLHNGRVAAALGRADRERRSYQAAIATVVRVQQGLTLHLRPGFLDDKGEALRALMAIYLRDGLSRRAFELLEQAKSQTLLDYIANRDQLRWPTNDPKALALRNELDELRAAHHSLYLRAHGRLSRSDEPRSAFSPGEGHDRLAAAEQRMRAITEQLYLLGDGHSGPLAATPPLAEIQSYLADDEALIEYYTDGARFWAFSLSRTGIALTPLELAPATVAFALDQLQLNLQAALRVGPAAPLSRRLAGVARAILGQLHTALLAPLAATTAASARLLIVPYGPLHYVPFHLLHDGRSHLIERQEVVILSAAGLLARPRVQRPRGVLAIAHPHDGALPHTEVEARAVHKRFGGQLYTAAGAVREILGARPTQILHIAAHGEQRLDQPDLSFISLADGQLYTDDLFQHDLSYELVTLSGCETGRAVVAAGDELVGLGRGILYAGAGALIASLWRVADSTTAALMEQLYAILDAGAPKALAMQQAQRALLAADPELHPAFWGAFQLVGDRGPLSHAEHRPSA